MWSIVKENDIMYCNTIANRPMTVTDISKSQKSYSNDIFIHKNAVFCYTQEIVIMISHYTSSHELVRSRKSLTEIILHVGDSFLLPIIA